MIDYIEELFYLFRHDGHSAFTPIDILKIQFMNRKLETFGVYRWGYGNIDYTLFEDAWDSIVIKHRFSERVL